MAHRHPRAALASLQLGRSVFDFIAEKRATEPKTPYRQIAVALRDATGGQTDVTDQTIRAWHHAATVEQASA